MENITIEISKNIKDTMYFLCHYCNQLIKKEEIIQCTLEDCQESFCYNCIKINFPEEELEEIKKESEENGWICFKCEKKCNCEKCIKKTEKQNKTNIINNNIINNNKLNNEISKKNIEINKGKNNLKNKIYFLSKKIEIKEPEKITKESGKDAYLIDTLYNGFKIIQDKSSTKFPYVSNQKNIISKFELQLIKVARGCEHFYRHKCNKNYINKKCYLCNKKEHHTNELIRFSTSKQFINYLRYLFICMENILNYNFEVFNINKKQFFDYYKNYEKGLTKWGFKNPKIICKLCIFKKLNKPNCLNFFQKNIKDLGNILIDSDNDSSDENINNKNFNCNLNNGNLYLYHDKKIKVYFNNKFYFDMQKLFFVLFQSINEFIMIIKKINIATYNKMYSFKNKDLIDFYQKIILVFQNVKNNYKKLKDYLEKYYHLINEFVNYAFSFIIKENRIMNNLLISNNEVKKVQNQFFELIENLITSFGEFVNRIKEQIKC